MVERELQPTFEKPTGDYLRVMTASPEVAVADPETNMQHISSAYLEAVQAEVELLTLPELCVTGYSTADLFFNRHVLEQSNTALDRLAEITQLGPAMVVGAPVEHDGLLYNCGILMANGEMQGIVPKSYLPNYNEFYEQRWFASGRKAKHHTVAINGKTVPFGTDLLFDVNGTKVGIEVCEDAFAPIAPSAGHVLAGAEVIVNLSASNELIGKDDYRRRLITGHAANFICGYVYTSAGRGESNADVVYSGHQLVSEVGKLSGEVKPLDPEAKSLVYDIDRTYIEHDRLINSTFREQALDWREEHPYRTIAIRVPRPTDPNLQRTIERGFKPRTQEEWDKRCEDIFNIMSTALAESINEQRTKGLIIGLSGGLDSTLVLLTTAYTCNHLGKPLDFIHTVTMPGMASSERTQDNATLLAEALGTTHNIMPINELSQAALQSIGHDQVTEDIAYENTQARMRTLLLMNYANMIRGMVVGTGDLSETAQGWCTYNGDHMSMYNPNASVPKSLVRDLVRWFAENRADEQTKNVLLDILDTPVSPELTGNGDLSQTTEDIIGPYELHDFFMQEMQRYGTRPTKIAYLAKLAFGEDYPEEELSGWLQSYLKRFTGSQWKRDVMPNGPMIGTVALSPRGPWRMAPNTSPDWYT